MHHDLFEFCNTTWAHFLAVYCLWLTIPMRWRCLKMASYGNSQRISWRNVFSQSYSHLVFGSGHLAVFQKINKKKLLHWICFDRTVHHLFQITVKKHTNPIWVNLKLISQRLFLTQLSFFSISFSSSFLYAAYVHMLKTILSRYLVFDMNNKTQLSIRTNIEFNKNSQWKKTTTILTKRYLWILYAMEFAWPECCQNQTEKKLLGYECFFLAALLKNLLIFFWLHRAQCVGVLLTQTFKFVREIAGANFMRLLDHYFFKCTLAIYILSVNFHFV